MNPALEGALKAARAGFHVFPCEAGGKRPYMTPRGRFQWGSGATTDERTILDWWTNRCPDANYGIAARPSKLIVIDCDMPKEGKQIPARYREPGVAEGIDILACIVADLDVPFPFRTLAVATPSGGVHFYFANPADLPMRNSSIVPQWIDVRANGGADGGFVVGPGSRRADGAEYRVVQSCAVQVAPPWVLALCAPAPERPAAITPTSGGKRSYDGAAKFDGLIEQVRSAQEGNRNSMLHWAACCMAKDGASINEAELILGTAAQDAGLPEHEITATIRSAYRSKGR